MARPVSGITQVFNYDDAATYTTGIAAGIVEGGTPCNESNDEKSYTGIGGTGVIAAGMYTVDDASVDLVLTNDSKVFLGLGLPASATAGFDAMSFLAADGESGWTYNNAFMKSVSIEAEVEEALKAKVGLGALQGVKGATVAQAALASSAPFMWHAGSVQIGAANYIIQSAKIDVEAGYKLYTDYNTGKSSPKRAAQGVRRTGLECKGEFESLEWYDSNIEDDTPTPANLVIVGSDGGNTITVTLTLTSGITTKFEWSYENGDGLETFKYSFTAPPNSVAVSIA